MAHCVISTIYDTDTDEAVPACVVHTHHAPCPRNGQPACATPVESWDDLGRDRAVVFWQDRTHGQRPLILHHGSAGDEIGHRGGRDCWCGPELFEAKSAVDRARQAREGGDSG
jgi:hypothetical protein